MPTCPLTNWFEEPLLGRGLPQCSVTIELRRQPTLKSFGVKYQAMSRVVVAHRRECVGEPPLQFKIKIGPRREHAMVVCGRGPDLAKAAFRHQALGANRIPEGAADCAGVGSPIEDSARHFNFAGPGISVFAYVTIEAQGAVVPAFAHALLLQKVTGQNSCVPAVPAA